MITKYPTGLPVTVQYSDVLFSVSIEQANVGLVCAVFGDFGVLPVTILKAGSRIKHQTVPVPMPTTQRSHLIRSQTFKIDATFGANAPSFFLRFHLAIKLTVLVPKPKQFLIWLVLFSHFIWSDCSIGIGTFANIAHSKRVVPVSPKALSICCCSFFVCDLHLFVGFCLFVCLFVLTSPFYA